MGLAIYTFHLITESLSTGNINLVLRSLTKTNILVFITPQGKILSASDNFSNLAGPPSKTSYTKAPLSEALGINESQVENMIKETTDHGSLSAQLLKNGSSRDIWWTSVAISNSENKLNCIVLVFRTNLVPNGEAEIPLTEEQRMLVEHYLKKAGSSQIEENQVIKTYFIEQINLLYSLAQQFNGTKMADNLLMHLQQVTQKNSWQFSYDGHDITIPEEYKGRELAHLLSALLQEAKNFAANTISPKLVEQEMANLDKNLGMDTLRYVDEYNLRSLMQGAL